MALVGYGSGVQNYFDQAKNNYQRQLAQAQQPKIQGPGLGYYGSQDVYTPQTQQPIIPQGNTNPQAPQQSSSSGDFGSDDYWRGQGFSTGRQGAIDAGLFQSAPQAPDLSQYSAAISEALASYDQLTRASEGSLAGNIQSVEGSGEVQRRGYQSALTNAEQNALTQKQTEQARTEEERNRISQNAGEIMLGQQARYGSATGTGRFANEILGREALRSISSNFQNLQNTIRTIDDNVNLARRDYQDKLFAIESETKNLVQSARDKYNESIAYIASAKAELGIRKADKIQQALSEYRSEVAQIQQANTTFTQTLYTQAKELEQKALTAKYDVSTAGTTFVQKNLAGLLKEGTITDEGIASAEKTFNLTPGTLQRAPKDDEDEEDLSEGW